MIVITIDEVIALVPSRWQKTYSQGRFANDRSLQDKMQKLLELNHPTKDEIDRIIGNDSWTALKCTVCGEQKTKLVSVETKAHSEYGPDYICRECLSYALTRIDYE